MRRVAYYPLEGGENLIVPALSANPGNAKFTANYEMDQYGRYRRCDGYERFDGRLSPSGASYWSIDFRLGSRTVSYGSTITGATSSATGIVLDQVLESGAYSTGDAEGYFILGEVSGTFQSNENLSVCSATVGRSSSTAKEKTSDTFALYKEHLALAIEYRRNKIATVPGSGSLLGVWQYNGVKYAFRNYDNTYAKMYKSTTAGWVVCDLGRTVAFTSGGTTEIAVGNTITGATSGATAVVRRVILTSGTWAGGDAAGTFVLNTQVGSFQSENLNVGAATNLATIGANSTETTFLKNGRFEFVNYNFGGHTGTYRMYGCDGVNKAFEWDGTVIVPLVTGMTTDKPIHIAVHKGKLFLAFDGGSVQHCSESTATLPAPYGWSVVTGAGELGIGDEITGFCVVPGDILAIKSRNMTHLLYGSASSGDDAWVLKVHSREAGAIEWTVQLFNNSLTCFDDRGMNTLSTTDAYGDYASSSISATVQPYLKDKTSSVACSMVVKEKNQYRLFFTDKQCLTMTMNGDKIVGFTRSYLKFTPTCSCSNENSTGLEELFLGGSDGYVYQIDSGNSYDGQPIESIIKTHYQYLKTPQQKKRILKIVLEIIATPGTEIEYNLNFDYGQSEYSEMNGLDVSQFAGIWGLSEWGSFSWEGQQDGTAEAHVDGTGINYALILRSSSINIDPHTLQGVMVHYIMRGPKR